MSGHGTPEGTAPGPGERSEAAGRGDGAAADERPGLLSLLSSDLDRLAEIKGSSRARALLDGLLFENGFQAVVCYRLAHACRAAGLPVLGPLLSRWGLFLTGADLSAAAEIGPGLYIAHGVGLVVGGGAKVGARAFLLHQATLGAPSQRRLSEMPIVGDDVFLGAGARVLGAVRLGDRVFVGAGAIVTEDVPDDHRVVAAGGVQVTPRQGGTGSRTATRRAETTSSEETR